MDEIMFGCSRQEYFISFLEVLANIWHFKSSLISTLDLFFKEMQHYGQKETVKNVKKCIFFLTCENCNDMY